ncbi:MAG TPA: T9SS type A sorting domain-containing protein [Clostridiales bacterium]|nr:T9SS type A sorting domain-containing protein [Clostridiales bacterium]HQP70651.1 T9SS type A sorting domain-containing protein [Clostridiales bacterium]
MKKSILIIALLVTFSYLLAFSYRSFIGQNVIGETTIGEDVVKTGIIYLNNVNKGKSNPVTETEILPFEFALEQNYPNPFNPVTAIQFSIPANQYVSLKVYNILGNEVAELAGREFNKGIHLISFNAEKYVSGLYFYKIDTKGFTKMKKMIIVK